MVSDPITVVARELGTNIPRAQIFKPEIFSRRLKGSVESNTSESLNQLDRKSKINIVTNNSIAAVRENADVTNELKIDSNIVQSKDVVEFTSGGTLAPEVTDMQCTNNVETSNNGQGKRKQKIKFL